MKARITVMKKTRRFRVRQSREKMRELSGIDERQDIQDQENLQAG